MDLLKMQERKDLFRQTVNRGDQYLRDKNFQTAIIQYQKALEYLENDPVVVHSIITNLMEIQSQMEAPEKEELINQLKSQEAAKKQILQELERIEKEYKEINLVSVEERSTDLMNNLNTKLTIKEVLASESIKEQYPDLSHKLDLYLEAYSREIEKKQQDQFLLFLQKFKENIF
jgi:lipopolysaccharide biosynthesis regulator YciM